MAYDDLRAWIKALDKAGELKRIHEPVDPVLEISEITDRVSKRGVPPGGPALLFENVKGYPGSQVLMNQFGSEQRMKLALDVESLDDVAGRIEDLLHVKSPEILGQTVGMTFDQTCAKIAPRTMIPIINSRRPMALSSKAG